VKKQEMTPEEMRARIVLAVQRQVSREAGRRKEAVRDYILVTLPNVDGQEAERLAALVPPVLPGLYQKWAELFADRLLETAPREQVALLLDGSVDGEAALVLAFVMFMESRRMEEEIEKDLRAYGLAHSWDEDQGALAAALIRDKVAELAAAADTGHKGGRKTPLS